jgi:hypothetical protein
MGLLVGMNMIIGGSSLIAMGLGARSSHFARIPRSPTHARPPPRLPRCHSIGAAGSGPRARRALAKRVRSLAQTTCAGRWLGRPVTELNRPLRQRVRHGRPPVARLP